MGPADSPLDLLLAHPGGLPIDGTDPVDLSLGGSETAVVSMARALRRLGHRVTVYCFTDEPHECCGVDYRPAGLLADERAGRDCDLLLATRFFKVLRMPVAARMYGLWFHDMPPAEAVSAMSASLARASFCFFLSRFHLGAYEAHFPDLGRHSILTTNGVDFDALEEIRGGVRSDSPPRFLYASRPERGLAFLLHEIWPVLKRRIPDAELLVTTYSFQGIRQADWAIEHGRLCDDLIRRAPGARQIGPLTRRQLWRELALADAVLYPTDFPESSCMVALEAQALGIPIVTTGRFALAETVGCRETLVDEPWRSPAYVRTFVDTAARLVEDPEFTRRAREAGRCQVTRESHSWDAIARSWDMAFRRLFRERFEQRKAGVLRRLLRDSDVEAARRLVGREPAAERVFHPADLAELDERHRGKLAELDEEPVWVDFPPDGRPPQLEETFRAFHEIAGSAGIAGSARDEISVLDVGCYAANLSLLLAGDDPRLRLTGVDGNPRAVALAARKARELGVEGRTRFLHCVDPHRTGDGCPELAPGSHDVVLLGEVLEYFADPVELLEWAEARARSAVVGYTLHGPWEALTGERFRLHHLGHDELLQMLGGKAELALRYFPCSETSRGEPLGGWLFHYRVAPGNAPGRLDLDRKILFTPPLPRISVNVLVKDEEAHIRPAVESVDPVADEILIGDTGCGDLTVDILESMGFLNGRRAGGDPGRASRRILEIPFEDFAQARNDLARHADGDYILWLDADETLINGAHLRHLVDFNEHFDAFAVEQRHLVMDTRIDSDFPRRCFRPETVDGPLRWFGCIHEHLEHRLNEGPRRVMICPEVFLAHLGYLHEQVRSNKLFQRNWNLFIKDRVENPGRLMGILLGIREYLMLAVAELGRSGGRMNRKAYRCLNYGFEVWHHHVRHMPPSLRDFGFGFSRHILELLARHGQPLRLTGAVPFRADLSIEIVPGAQPVPAGDRPRQWTFFADLDEMRDEMERRLTAAARHPALEEIRPIAPPIELDSAPELRSWSLPPELFGLEPFR